MKYIIGILLFGLIILGCSTKKNTQSTRMYHEINTRYNVYFNADQAYKETLKSQLEGREENLSKLLDVYPIDKTAEDKKNTGGSFDATVDKTTKAIKLHSITAKPKRDPSKKKDQEYQLWLQQQEFNPFLKNAWLLLGKGEYQNKDYLLASSTFSYIIRLYRTDPLVVMEARLWLAKSYQAMGWHYEAENIFHTIALEGGVSPDLESLYSEIYADLLVRKKEYREAIPYIEKAIKGADGIQKLRLRYLLGQAYALADDKEGAYKAFQDVQGMNTPYEYTFNAKIQQATFVDNTNRKKVLSELNKMTRGAKNKDYLDQVYYAIGNIYLNERDTIQAIEAYKKAIDKSTRNGYDKAVVQVLLGDLYFEQRNYVDAQPVYSDALSQLDKHEANFERVEHRSSVLDELVVYIKAIHLQDSLQLLARMPEDQRLAAINKVIIDFNKKEQEQKRLQEDDNSSNNQSPQGSLFSQTTPAIPSAPLVTGGNNTSFYFYNPQVVQQGKTAFQSKWGNRKLEDNWRRQNKQVSIFGSSSSDTPKDDNDQPAADSKEELARDNDPHYPEYYLKQIPFSDEALKQSNKIIEDAYFNSGLIYKDKLENYELAIDSFNKDLERFPNTPNKEEIYYQLFLIYLRLGNKDMTESYRRLLLKDFADGDYAKTLRSSDYEWNLRNIYKLQDKLYQDTYDAYLVGNIKEVRANYKTITEKYPLSDLMPKFMYLNALTYAQSKDPKALKDALSELIDKYPKSDITPIASEMLKGLLSGRNLSPDSSVAKGMIWDMKFTTNIDSIGAAGVDFIVKTDTEYLLLFIYPSATVDKNELLYQIADYNFSKFVYKTFDLNFNEVNNLDVLQVRGFDSFKDITDYVDLAFQKGSLMDQLNRSIVTVPISADNYIALMNGKSLNEYFIFFEKNYRKEMVKLITLWNKQRIEAEKKVKEEDIKIEEVIESETPKTDNTINESVDNTTTATSIRNESADQKQISTDEKEIANEINVDVEDILSEEVIEKADLVINKAADIIANPIDGLKSLFNSSNDGNEMTKEEKETAKKARKEAKEIAQKRKAEEKARKKAEEKAQLELEEAIEQKENAYNDSIKNIQKLKEEEVKTQQEAKKEDLKAKQVEKQLAEETRKQALKERELERKQKQREREQERKEKEKQRKALQKEREQERKEKAKQRKMIQEQKERERKAKKAK